MEITRDEKNMSTTRKVERKIEYIMPSMYQTFFLKIGYESIEDVIAEARASSPGAVDREAVEELFKRRFKIENTKAQREQAEYFEQHPDELDAILELQWK